MKINLKSIVKNYFIATSVLFHLLASIALFWIVPIFINAQHFAADWKKISAKAETGKILDICNLERNGFFYQGYSIDYHGKSIYLMGNSRNDYKIGEEVKVIVSDHPSGLRKTLIVMLEKIKS